MLFFAWVIAMTTGQKIKEARKNAGLTQAQLADKLGVPFQSISQWERDLRKPKIESLERIADALNLNLSSFLGLDTLPDEKAFFESIQDLSGKMAAAINSETISRENRERLNNAFVELAELKESYLSEVVPIAEGTNELYAKLKVLIFWELQFLNFDGLNAVAEKIEELACIPKYQLLPTDSEQ